MSLPETLVPTDTSAAHRDHHGFLHERYNDGHLLTFTIPDLASVRTGSTRFTLPIEQTILGVSMSVGTAPTGASLIVDVNRNGSTIYTTQANRPTITATTFVTAAETVPDVTSLVAGDYLTFDIDQIGSTISGSDIVIVVRAQ